MNRSARFVLACLVVAATSPFAAADTPEESLAKYYRKKNNVPAQAKVTVQGLKDSTNFKGSKEGTVMIGEGPGAKTIGFVASPDLKWVVFGDLVDTSVDPAKLVMQKIDLKTEPFEGAKDAKVVIVEYSDFQCPFCSRVEGTVDQVVKAYPNDVRVAFKQLPLPFHNNAHTAAEAALAAKAQGKFWEMHDKMFANQQALDRPSLERYAQEIGLDVGKFKAALDGGKHKAAVAADMSYAQGLGGGMGTPTFFINGRKIMGAMPIDTFVQVIDEELGS